MQCLLVALWLVAAFVPHVTAEGDPPPSQNGLSIAIIPTKDKAGSWIIERGDVFQVAFTNRSARPVHLWSEFCRLGYETLSFRVEGGDSEPSLMRKVARDPLEWRNKPLKTSAIPPGGTLVWDVAPSSIWGEREWKGVPEPNTGKAIKLQAIFEIRATDAAKKHGVWTGRVTSQPVQTLVVDPKLRTPHDYLWARCPKQAQRVIQADRTWVNKLDYGHAPLHLAAHRGFVDVVSWLVSNGADVNATANNRATPLHMASDPAVVKALLAGKPDLTLRDSAVLQSPLERATLMAADRRQDAVKWREIVKLLLDAGAEYGIQSAIHLDDLDRVRAILKNHPESANGRRGAQKVPLRVAARGGRLAICNLLLQHNADPNDFNLGSGIPILCDALGHPEIVKALMGAGAEAKKRITWRGGLTKVGIIGPDATLLHYAAMGGQIDSARLLVNHGIEVDARDETGQTALHIAAFVGRAAMVRYLLERGADPRAKANNGKMPLDVACALPHDAFAEEPDAEERETVRILKEATVPAKSGAKP